MHPLCCWNLSDWIRSDQLVKVSCFLVIILVSCAICESSSGLKIRDPQSTRSTLKMCCCLCLTQIDQLCPLGSIGATTSGVCIHCHAGTYQTGSGQMQWWWVDWLLVLICWYLWALCIVYDFMSGLLPVCFNRGFYVWCMQPVPAWNVSDWVRLDAVTICQAFNLQPRCHVFYVPTLLQVHSNLHVLALVNQAWPCFF